MPCSLSTTRTAGRVEYAFVRDGASASLIAQYMFLAAAAIGPLISWIAIQALSLSPQVALLAGVASSVLLAWHLASTSVAKETLVVHDQLGVVLEQYSCTGKRLQCSFVDQADVEALIINEVLSTTSVHTFLTFMIKGQQTMAVAFQALRPRLSQLVQLYQELLHMGYDMT